MENHAAFHSRKIAAGADTQKSDADEVSAVDPDHVKDSGEQRHRDEAGDDARRDQILDRIDRHGVERIDLFSDLHTADLCRHRRAGSAGDHKS